MRLLEIEHENPVRRGAIIWLNHLRQQFQPDSCPFCDGNIQAVSDLPGHKLNVNVTLPVCQQCFDELPWCNEPGLALGEHSAFYYFEPIRQYILSGKGRKQLDKLQILARLTAIQFAHRKIQHPQAIIPVPLHRSRIRQRGFNQAIELIRPFAQQSGIPLLTQHIYRNRHTNEQKGLSESSRKLNTQHAFSLHKPIAYQHVAIFDDVVTTGATCSALKALLLECGVKKVEIWCCATTKQ